MRASAFLILALLAACAPRGEPPPAAGPERGRAAAAGLGPGFDSASVEREFEAVRGPAAMRRVRSAPVSAVAAFYQGLPTPTIEPDGRVTYAGPAVNAVVRERGRWLGWKTGKPAPVPAEVAARLDALVADPGLWREPEAFPRGACTDSGSLQLGLRHEDRRRFSWQDNCRSRGLTGELARIVLAEALVAPY